MSEDDKKLFVGGLSWNTTEDKMKEYFSQYGTVLETKVMRDRETNDPRGFGFVTFSDPSSVSAVLKEKTHLLDDKQVDPKPCTPMEVQRKRKEAEKSHISTHKIFVGGLPRDITKEEVTECFEKCGEVLDVTFAINNVDNTNKGFGFVTFKEESAAAQAVKQHYHDLGTKRIEAKKAEPRDSRMRKQYHNQGYQQWNYGGPYQPNQGYGQMGWGGYNMDPSGGYMPNSGYGYGNMYPGYGYGYGNSYPQQGPNGQGYGYANMGNYNNQYNSSYGPAQSGESGKNESPGKDSSSSDSKTGYHPYKR